MLPTVLGVACTDKYGRLYYEHEGKKKLISRAPKVPNWICYFDLNVFNRFLDTHWKDSERCLIVAGENTYLDAKGPLHRRLKSSKDSALMTSSNSGICLIHTDKRGAPVRQEVFTHCLDDSLQNLRISAYDAALTMKADKIIVLGGHSVYQAFSGCYDVFLSCMIHSPVDVPTNLEKRLEIKALLSPNRPQGDNQFKGTGWMQSNHKLYTKKSVFVDFDYTVEEITSIPWTTP